MTKLNQILCAAATGVLCATSVMAGGLTTKANAPNSVTLKVGKLDPYTHFASIPDNAELSSIKFLGVKKVKVTTRMKSATDVRYCEDQQFRDPGGSMYCPYTQTESPSDAYQVTYSYRGQPMASDEYGNTHFTLSVYFRPDELSPAVRDELAKRTMTKSDEAGYFHVTTYRASVRRIAIDEAASTFCAGNYVDGAWTHTDSKCGDSVRYTAITAPSAYVTVKVDPALSLREHEQYSSLQNPH